MKIKVFRCYFVVGGKLHHLGAAESKNFVSLFLIMNIIII